MEHLMHTRTQPWMGRLVWSIATLIVGVVTVWPAEAIVMRHDVSEQRYLDRAADFESLGRLTGSRFSASGVLIGPDLVLTAGHVVDAMDSGSRFTVGGTSYGVSSYEAHDRWDGSLLAGYDVGLVKLDRMASGVEWSTLLRGGGEFGNWAVWGGFGRTGTGFTGFSTPSDGRARAATNRLEKRYGDRVLVADFDTPLGRDRNAYLGSSTPTSLEGLLAPGDSGGGVWVWEDGWKLAGVNSFVMSLDGVMDGDYSEWMGMVRTTPHRDWLEAAVAASLARQAGTPPETPEAPEAPAPEAPTPAPAPEAAPPPPPTPDIAPDPAPTPRPESRPPSRPNRGGGRFGRRGAFDLAAAQPGPVVPEPGTAAALLMMTGGLVCGGRRRGRGGRS
jgi:hypothetical protein